MLDVNKYLNSLIGRDTSSNQNLVDQFKLLLSRLNETRDLYNFTASDVILMVDMLKSDPQLMAVCAKRNQEDNKVIIDGISDAPRDDLYDMFGDDYQAEILETIQGIMQNMTGELSKLFASEVWVNNEPQGWSINRAVIAEFKRADIDVSIGFTSADDVGLDFYANVLLEMDEFYLDL